MHDVAERASEGQGGGMAPARTLSLKARVVRGAGWVAGGRGFSAVMQAVKVVVLTRLLTPKDFGLFSIVMLLPDVLDIVSRTGFDVALVQRRDDASAYLNTAWTVQIARGLALAGVVFLVAPAVAAFFEVPQAAAMLRVICISLVVRSWTNIGIIYFRKDLEFHRQFVYDALSSFVATAVAVAIAFYVRSVWAFVWADVAGTSTRFVLSYCVHPYRPRVRLDLAQAAELFRFGRWMLGNSIILFLSNRLDVGFLGRMMGASALGLYQVALRPATTAAMGLVSLSDLVVMPAYAKVQDDTGRLGRAFLDVLEIVASLALPLAVFVALGAREILVGVFGPQWAEASSAARILAAAGFLRAVSGTGSPVFLGSGRPHLNFYMNLTRFAVMAAVIYPLTRFLGIRGTSYAMVFSLAATVPMWARAVAIAGVSWGDVLRRCQPALLLALLVPIGFYAGRLVPSSNVPIALVCEAAGATGMCVLGVWLAGHWFGRGLYPQAVRCLAALREKATLGAAG
jgi:O-antigen/teichoic acid export membrane protein